MAKIKPYLIVNLVLAGVCGLIFLYSGIFSAEKDNHPLPSFYEKITGHPSPSSGMSRAFSEIIRGNIASARRYNPDSVRIFAFFLIQGLQRIAVSLILIRIGRVGNGPGSRTVNFSGGRAFNPIHPGHSRKILSGIDAALSGILFLVCFGGQIRAMIGLLNS